MNTPVDNTCTYMYSQIGLHENSTNPYITDSISIISKDVTDTQIIHEVHEPNSFIKQSNVYDFIDHDSILAEFNNTHSEGFRCHICSFLLPSSRILRHHLVKIHAVLNTVSYFCPLCDHECWSEEQLNYHLNLHHGIKRAELACIICGVELSAKCEVKAHQRKHELSYSCYSCSQKFGAKHLLLLHTQDHIAKLKPYACCLCGKRFKHAKAYFLHEWRHSKQSCPESTCNIYFGDESYLLYHLQERHKMNDQKLKELVNSKDELDRTIDFLLCLVLKENIIKLIDLETCNEESYSTFSFIFDTEESDFYNRENWDDLKRKFCNDDDLNYDKICELKEQLEAIILDFNIKEEKSIFEGEKELIKLENLLYNKQSKYVCGLCNMSFASFALYQNHVGTHRKSFKCHSCPKSFSSLKHLRRHSSFHRNKGNLKNSLEENHVIKCNECGKLFLSEKSLNHHRELSHKRSKRPKCKFCHKAFASKGNLNEHLNLFHKDLQLSRNKKYYCSICDRGLISKGNYVRHLSTHDIGPSLSCPKCSKKFVRAIHLNRHIAEHDKTHHCNICGSVYSSLSKLSTHYSSHNEELKERFPCEFCELTFPYKSQLKSHTLIHTKEKPYVCEKCGKAFKRLQQCKVHSKLVHSDKNIQCNECLKFFGTEFNLTRHRFACHMNLKRWICGICGHSYGYSQDLRNHLHKIHSYDLKAIDYKSKKSRSEVYVIPELGSFEICSEARIQIENLYQEESRKLKEFLSTKSTQSSNTRENSTFQQPTNLSIENIYPQPAVNHTYPVTIQIHPNQFQTCIGNGTLPVLVPSEIEGNATENFNQKLNTVYRSNLCDYCKATLNLNCKIYFCKECSLTFCSLPHVNAHITLTHGKIFQCSVCYSQFNSREKCVNHILECHQIQNPSGQVIWLQPEVEYFPQSNISQLPCTPLWPNTNSVLQIVPGANPQHMPSLPISAEDCLIPNHVKPIYQVLPINSGIQIPGQAIDKVVHGNVSNNPSLYLVPNTKNLSSLPVLPTVYQSENTENLQPKGVPEDIILPPSCLQNQQVLPNNTHIADRAGGSKGALCTNVTNAEASDAPQVGASIEISSAAIGSSSNYCVTPNGEEIKTEYSDGGPSNPLGNLLIEEHLFLGLNKNTHEYHKNEEKVAQELPGSQEVKPISINKKLETKLKKKDNSPLSFYENSSSKVFYKCRICEKLFDSLMILERHNKIHNSKKFTCAVCDKKFVEKYNLKIHLLTHTKERPRECTHCSKKFRYYRDLKDHLRSHSGALPFNCSTCGSKFQRARDLKRHCKEQHSAKKYKCSQCNKVFGRRYYLDKYHMKTHTKKVTKKNSESSTCNKCLKEFSSSEMENHSCNPENASKNLPCTKCGKTFQKKRSLSAHLRVHCEKKKK